MRPALYAGDGRDILLEDRATYFQDCPRRTERGPTQSALELSYTLGHHGTPHQADVL